MFQSCLRIISVLFNSNWWINFIPQKRSFWIVAEKRLKNADWKGSFNSRSRVALLAKTLNWFLVLSLYINEDMNYYDLLRLLRVISIKLWRIFVCYWKVNFIFLGINQIFIMSWIILEGKLILFYLILDEKKVFNLNFLNGSFKNDDCV